MCRYRSKKVRLKKPLVTSSKQLKLIQIQRYGTRANFTVVDLKIQRLICFSFNIVLFLQTIQDNLVWAEKHLLKSKNKEKAVYRRMVQGLARENYEIIGKSPPSTYVSH